MHERLVMEHYLLDSLDMVTRDVQSPSRQRLRSDVEEYTNDWEPKALEILRDFATLCCMDEMCHYGQYCTSHCVEGIAHTPSHQEYTRESTLKRAMEIFNKGVWKHAYGGTPWLGIAQAAYTPLSNPRAAINHMVNLCHNNGTIFSREYMGLSVRLISTEDSRFAAMKRFLRKLTDEGPLWGEYIHNTKPPMKIGAEVLSLVNRAKVLELVSIDLDLLTPEMTDLPPTLVWGTAEFPQLIERYCKDEEQTTEEEKEEDE